MTARPVFTTLEQAPFYAVFSADFTWSSGMAVSQSRKNIAAMHSRFHEWFPDKKVLEISSKSEEQIGVDASAFNLKLYVPSLEKRVPVECVYQSSKVFASGGPYTDLITASPKNAKRDPRLSSGGRLLRFCFEGVDHPLTDGVGFYDFIYIKALLDNPDIAAKILEYDAFTDIAFNPAKGRNCQARAAAVFVSLHRLGKLDALESFEAFRSICVPHAAKPAAMPRISATAPVSAPARTVTAPTVAEGDIVIHKVFGRGTVKELSPESVKVSFETVGDKLLGLAWVKANCGVEKGSPEAE